MKNSIIIGLVCLFSSATLWSHGSKGSVGAGIGTGYGILGVSTDRAITENLYVTLAVGTTTVKSAFNTGVRYYFRDADKLWRPRLTLQYGTNGIIERSTCFYYCIERKHETFKGTSLGLGQSIAFGSKRKHGIDVDIMYKINDGGLSDRRKELVDDGYLIENETNNYSLSIGYRYNF